MTMSLAELNGMDQAPFTEALGWIFEHAPWVAERAWQERPFSSVRELHGAMVRAVAAAPRADQLALIRAHPDLGTRAKIAPASRQEQSGAGLDRLSAVEYQRLASINQTYTRRFGFPFIMAVRGQTREAILAALAERVRGTYALEFERALQEVYQIAWFRLEEAVRE